MWRIIKQTIKRDRAVGWGLLAGGLMVLGQLAITAWWGWRLPPQIPLFYSLPVGEQQLAGAGWFLILPIAGWIFYFSEYGLIGLSGGMVKVFADMVVWLTNIALFLLTIAMIHILMLVY